MEIIIVSHLNMYVGIWCIYEEIGLKMMTMGEPKDAKMDALINKIMTNWKPNR